jgi:hypothetical protein
MYLKERCCDSTLKLVKTASFYIFLDSPHIFIQTFNIVFAVEKRCYMTQEPMNVI